MPGLELRSCSFLLSADGQEEGVETGKGVTRQCLREIARRYGLVYRLSDWEWQWQEWVAAKRRLLFLPCRSRLLTSVYPKTADARVTTEGVEEHFCSCYSQEIERTD